MERSLTWTLFCVVFCVVPLELVFSWVLQSIFPIVRFPLIFPWWMLGIILLNLVRVFAHSSCALVGYLSALYCVNNDFVWRAAQQAPITYSCLHSW